MPETDLARSKTQTHVYGWRTFAGDVSGGAIAALIALPYGLAMAKLMGLPASLGIFTSVLTAPATAFLGRNPVLIGGTASATVPFIAAAVHSQGIEGAAKVCLAASGFLLTFWALKLGRYIVKVPHAVVSGFSCGVGAMMIMLQLRTLLGLPSSPSAASSAPIKQAIDALSTLREARWEPLALGAIVMAVAALTARRWPRSPAALGGVILAAAAAWLFGWSDRTVGAVSAEFPRLVRLSWGVRDFTEIVPSALGLAFVTSVNVLITSRVVDHFRGRHRARSGRDADLELGAYGVANVCAGVFGAPMSVGIPARSLANVRCGGTTRLSNLLHALILLTLVRFGSTAIATVPLSALAGVTAYVGLGLMEWSTWRRLPRMRKVDATAFLATAAAVNATNAVVAVSIGCSLYVVRHLYLKGVQIAPKLQPARPRDAEP